MIRNQAPVEQSQARDRVARGRASAAAGERPWSARYELPAVLGFAVVLATAAAAHAEQQPTQPPVEQTAEQQTVLVSMEYACYEGSSPSSPIRCYASPIALEPGEAPSAGERGTALGNPLSWVATAAAEAAVNALVESGRLEAIHNSVRQLSPSLNRIDNTLKDVNGTLQRIDGTQQKMVEALDNITVVLQRLNQRIAATEEASARP